MDIRQIIGRPNIVDLLDDSVLTDLATRLKEQYTADLQSRAEANIKLQKIMNMGLMDPDSKDTPFPGCSNVVFPLTAAAIYEYFSKAIIEILRDDIVKPKIIGKDEGKIVKNDSGQTIADPESGEPIFNNVGAKFKRGERVATYMNWQLSYQMKNWKKDMMKLIPAEALLGTMFTKTFYDPVNKQPELYPVFPDKVIVNNKARSLEEATITEIIELYEQEIVERIRSGVFIEFNYSNDPSSPVTDHPSLQKDKQQLKTGLHSFLVSYCNYDLDEDGYPEPYIVTIHEVSGKVVRIVARCEKEGIITNSKGQIVKINALNLFTIYNFLPDPSGSIYGIGLGHLLLNPNDAINAGINQLFDAGKLKNFGGGFIAADALLASGENRVGFNEYKQVDSRGMAMRDAILPNPTPEPSQTTFVLLDFLAQNGKELGMLKNILTGEQGANIAPTTALAMVDQGIKSFKAIYLGIYESLKCDFKKIFDMNYKYLSDQDYAMILDEPLTDVSVKMDFNSKDLDIVPVGDIDSIMTMQRMAKANILMQFINDPYFDGIELRTRILEAANINNIDKLLIQPQPQPDPLVQMEMLKQENRSKEIEIEAIKAANAAANAAELLKYQIKEKEANIGSMESKAILNIAQAEAQAQGSDKDRQLEQYRIELEHTRDALELHLKNKEMEMAAEQRQKQVQAEQEQQEQQNIPADNIENQENTNG